MEKQLLEYCILQHRNIGHYLDLCLQRSEAESVHQLRVSIKKFKAVSKLLEYLLPETGREKKQQLIRLRALFKLAGRLRDAQVQMNLFNYYRTGTGIQAADLENWLIKTEKSASEQFNAKFALFGKSITIKPFGKLNRKELSSVPDELFRQRATGIIDKRIGKVRQLIRTFSSDDELHTIRIQVKQIRYMLGVLAGQDEYFSKFAVVIAELKAIETRLGRWHDLTVFRETIEKYIDRKQKKNKGVPDEILRLNGAVIKDIELFREQILLSFREGITEPAT